MPHGAACAIIFILFYDRSWQGEVLRLMKDLFFFSISSRFGQFPEIFGQVKEWFVRIAWNDNSATRSCLPNGF